VRWVRGFGTKSFMTFGHPKKHEDEEEEEEEDDDDDGFIEYDRSRAMLFKLCDLRGGPPSLTFH
jgi:hypothetical protein